MSTLDCDICDVIFIFIIRVQMAYCQQMLGNTAEAMKIYNSVLKNKPSDGAVSAVAANNTVTINQVM